MIAETPLGNRFWGLVPSHRDRMAQAKKRRMVSLLVDWSNNSLFASDVSNSVADEKAPKSASLISSALAG